jgi:uncharacterized lipoprotein YmbA
MFRKRLFIWLLCFVPAGCSFLEPQPDPTRYFALTSLPRTGQTAQDAGRNNPLALGIGPIKFPGYLDRQQIVSRISQNRFAVAENNRWAEPLEENFSRVLAQNLSILLQTDRLVTYPWARSQQPTYQVQVEVLRFEPNAEQLVELWARWTVFDNAKKIVTVRESHLSQPTGDKSTESAVAALSEVAADLSKEIAATLRAIISG